MLVICKKCNASYAVPATKIGPIGTNVKCAKCANIWYVKANHDAYIASQNISQSLEEISSSKDFDSNFDEFKSYTAPLPIFIKNEVSLFYKLMPIILTLMIIFVGVICFYEKLSQVTWINEFYKKYGYEKTVNVTFQNITITKSTEDNGENLHIGGEIVNNTSKKAPIPDLRLVVYNKNKEELLGHTVENRHKILNPGEKYIINNMIKNLSPYADTLILDIGNELELKQR